MIKINHRIDQSACNYLRGQSIARAAVRHIICIYRLIAKQRTENVMIVVLQDILQSIASDIKASQINQVTREKPSRRFSVTHSAAASYKCTFRVIHPNGKDCYASGIVDSRAEASLLPHSLYRKWIGVPLSKSNARLFSFNNTEIAGLKGQFRATIEYNGP
uniref:Uncharacterized protein n=1 Tax=Romanomermis culicivorax TaxID=13658 RepID=A0A915HUI2_ROMCU